MQTPTASPSAFAFLASVAVRDDLLDAVSGFHSIERAWRDRRRRAV